MNDSLHMLPDLYFTVSESACCTLHRKVVQRKLSKSDYRRYATAILI